MVTKESCFIQAGIVFVVLNFQQQLSNDLELAIYFSFKITQLIAS